MESGPISILSTWPFPEDLAKDGPTPIGRPAVRAARSAIQREISEGQAARHIIISKANRG